VDRDGATIDYVLCAHRNLSAARRFIEQAISMHGLQDKITIYKCGSNTATVASVQMDSGAVIEMRQSKYLNDIVEQSHGGDQAPSAADDGFNSFHCARAILTGIKTMHMIRKGQMDTAKVHSLSAPEQFDMLAH
jgi:transposase-like protein